MSAQEPAAAQQSPELRPTRAQARAQAGTAPRPRRAPFLVLLLAVLGAGLCTLLVLNTATAASEVQERQLDASNRSLTDSAQQLSRDIADAQAPANLARMAAALGLVPADSPAFLRLNPDGSATVLGKPARVRAPISAAELAAEREAAALQRKADALRAAAKRKNDAALAKATKKADAVKAAAAKAAAKAAAAKAPKSAAKSSATPSTAPTPTSTPSPTPSDKRTASPSTSAAPHPTGTTHRTTVAAEPTAGQPTNAQRTSAKPTTALLPGGQR